MAKVNDELDAQELEAEASKLAEDAGVSSSTPDESDGQVGDDEEMDEDAGGLAMGDPAARSANVPISELRKVRAEAAKYRRRLRQLESEIQKERKAVELSKMEETDRLKAIAAEAEAKANALKKRADAVAKQTAVITAASGLGFHNPRDAAAMVDLRQIEADDDGNVDEEKANELVKSLAESKPYLIRGDENEIPAYAGMGAGRNTFSVGPSNPPSDTWPKPKLRSRDLIDRFRRQSREALESGKVAAAVKLYNRAWEMERGIKKK
jgi:hypothetical protein